VGAEQVVPVQVREAMRSGEACTERSRSVVFGPGGGAVGVAGQGGGAM
jgi:hypothetical protein